MESSRRHGFFTKRDKLAAFHEACGRHRMKFPDQFAETYVGDLKQLDGKWYAGTRVS